MKEIFLWILNFLGLAYWVEIVTDYPRCTYYFGPFLSYQEAQKAQGGYVEDLQQENAQGIAVTIERTKPANLTIFDEKEEIQKFQRAITLSGTVY
ncbi:MAG: DUF1816 domain-containing protein [Hydrococcus sp. Prado102]|jgi:hypothetical protein|nr:DUF1816 domain-containing protein [Hydrococcus sp. Prado102]